MDECPHGMGDPAWCTLCNGRTAAEEREARQVHHFATARYDGYCHRDDCRVDIHVGDRIAITNDQAVICAECAAEWGGR